MRFNLIDSVVEQTPDHIVALKCVSSAEEYLADHFPGFAVLPGVMMLETLVQAGRLLAATGDAAARGGPMVLTEARNVRYSNMVRPGQSLRVRVSVRKRDAAGLELDGVGSVEDDVVVQCRFRLASLDKAP
jgi:3-hydroxyacyl-[acyl-carrier-protein] dehydratase